MSGLSPTQYDFLLRPIHESRVSHTQGHSHVEAWDIRRNLIRCFGIGGWDFHVVETEMVYSATTPQIDNGGKEVPGKFRTTAVYRVTGRLIVKGLDGEVVATYEDGATGDGVNQPSIGDAHDQALKTAMSQALKRCAANLGDQFGLSLYNDGSLEPVVVRTLGYTPPKRDGES